MKYILLYPNNNKFRRAETFEVNDVDIIPIPNKYWAERIINLTTGICIKDRTNKPGYKLTEKELKEIKLRLIK